MNFLKFLRFPGVFTAVADILAGFFIIRFSGLDYERIGYLPNILAASICFYLAGMAWNDLFDVQEDSRFRPERPLPSGNLSMTGGFITATVLSVGGLMFSMTAGMATFLVGSLLMVLIFLYNAVLKNIEFVGPLAMGGCRGLNLFFGMCAHTYILLLVGDPRVYLPPIITFCYIVVITVLSEMESNDQTPTVINNDLMDVELSTEIELDSLEKVDLKNPVEAMHHNDLRRKHDLHIVLSQNKLCKTIGRNKEDEFMPLPPEPLFLWLIAALIAAVPLAAGFLLSFNWLSWLITLVLFAYLAFPLIKMLRVGSGVSVKHTVGAGISGICLLDAALAASMVTVSPDREIIVICALIAGMLLPTVILRRYISVS